MIRLQPWHLALLLFPLLVLLHLRISPFTKVEESFNMQAAHDILTYGVPTQNAALRLKGQYDHLTFPGAVPRSFIGALNLAGIAKPVLWLKDGMDQQQVVRAILGLFNASALVVYTIGVGKAFGRGAAMWYIFLQASQFHIFYYSSRTLPNMFAFGISTLALRYLLPDAITPVMRVKRTRLALYLLTLATVIFRAELVLLILAHCLYLLAQASTNGARVALFSRVMIPAGLLGLLIGLALTVSIDSFFWQSPRPIWPELSAFMSNIFPSADNLGASAWGTSPWHWYFTSALPRLFLNPLFYFLLLAPTFTDAILRTSTIALLVPSLLYAAFYSFLPHKETRFLFPILPSLTTVIALAGDYISSRRDASYPLKRRYKSFLTAIIIVLTLLTTFVSHVILLPLSALNYPGAHALTCLHKLAHNTQPHVSVHLDNLALQTGVTRFLQLPPPSSRLIILPGNSGSKRPELKSGGTFWSYDKTENATELLDPLFWERFDYAVMEMPGRAIGSWEVVKTIHGLGRPRLLSRAESLEMGTVDERSTWAGLLGQMYGEWAVRGYKVFEDVVRYGDGMHTDWSWTRGWWVEWGLEEKLYILKKVEGAQEAFATGLKERIVLATDSSR